MGRTPVSAPALYGYGYRVRDRDMYRVRDRVRVRGLAIAAPSYSGPNRFQWGRKLEFARFYVCMYVCKCYCCVIREREIQGTDAVVVVTTGRAGRRLS